MTPGQADAADIDLAAFATPGFTPDVVDGQPDPADVTDHDEDANA